MAGGTTRRNRPQALTIEKAGYGVESATVLIIMAPKGLGVAKKSEKK